jgi:two-component system OmpR family sensor kinase
VTTKEEPGPAPERRRTGLWARTPLRLKLVATLVALVVAALGVAGFATAAALRSYLFQRVDSQLAGTAHFYEEDHDRGPGPGGGGGGGSQYYHRLTDGTGALEEVSQLEAGRAGPKLPVIGRDDARLGHAFTVGSTGGDAQWRVLAVARPGGGVATVARDVTDETNTVDRLVSVELVIGLTVVLLLGGIGYVLVRRNLRPLVEVEETAAAIAAGDLSRRVPESDERTEVGRLAAALNTMLHQIESAFRVREASETAARRSEERMRRFVTDASHELRTPLTSIRGFAELYRQGAASSPEDLARLMRRIEDEGARMGLLVDDLLLLARLDRERPIASDVVDLVPLAADAVHDAHALDPSRPVTLVAAGSFSVVGDESRLRQILGNLVGNALKHTPAGTPVRVGLAARDVEGRPYAVLSVSDEGPGLAAADAERVFERFYRADPSRARTEGGAGLGLAIVSALAAAHGGTVEVETSPGNGATFRVLLPLAYVP